MEKEVIFLKVKPEIKMRLKEIAERERRSLTSIVLFLIEEKINEVKNAN